MFVEPLWTNMDFRGNPVKSSVLVWCKSGKKTSKTRVLFKVTHLLTFTEQKILLLMANIENEPTADYAMDKHRN
jgi:hypothetical protein